MTAGSEAMIAACPHCGARYRIERERVPAQGARLRCSRCEAIFRVNPPAPAAAQATEGRPPHGKAAERPRSEPQASEVRAPASWAAERPRSEPQAGEVRASSAAERPQGEAQPGEGARADSSAAAGRGRQPLVLVADPDVEAGKVLAGALAGWGIETVLVHDGVEAVLTIQRSLPSLVVLEASLPKMFGFQVCELMKRNEQLRVIPVVLVGAIHHRDRYRRQAAERYGADEYLERPQLPEGLLGILRRLGIAAALAPVASAPTQRSEAHAGAGGRGGEPSPRRVEAERAPGHREVAPPAAPASSAPATDPELAADIARAERLARIIVSDIVLYNPERFEAAMRSGDVVGAMAAELDEGRAHFRERISERIRERRDFLGEELVRIARMRGMR